MFHLVLESHDGRAPGADSEEKHEPVSDIDTVVVDSLKALDPEWPIREADIAATSPHVAEVPGAVVSNCNNFGNGIGHLRPQPPSTHAENRFNFSDSCQADVPKS